MAKEIKASEIWCGIGRGVLAALINPAKLVILCAYLLGFWATVTYREVIFNFSAYGWAENLLGDITYFAVILIMFVVLLGLLFLLGIPFGAIRAQNGLRNAGIVNHIGEPPRLLSRKMRDRSCKLRVWRFDARAIPCYKWQDKQAEIEAALNVSILSISYGEDHREILVQAVSARGALPEVVRWSDEYISYDEAELKLGIGLASEVRCTLDNQPHIYIGGETSSGKSNLFKILLYQNYLHGHRVYLCDFKGGVDFKLAWRMMAEMIFDEAALLCCLESVVEELEKRKELFRQNECANIKEYNSKMLTKLNRIVLGIDEVAEVFVKAGSKDQKECLSKIENHLSLIARQGRAFGIHLILSTQRGDATVLPAQIRSNLNVKIAGRCDAILSQIIIDSTDAAKLIPKKAQGRFLQNDGTMFQAYYLDKENL